MNAALSNTSSERLLTILEDVQARLSSICSEMPAPEFDRMVHRIASVQLTFEQYQVRFNRHWS